MNRLKYLIILLILIIIIAIVSIVLVINVNASKDKRDGNDTEEREFVTEYKNQNRGKVQNITSISDFELAQICLQKFYIYYSLIFDESIINAGENVEFNLDYYKSALSNLLTSEYREKYGITIENIDTILGKNEYDSVEIYNMYYVTNFENTKVYLINGLLRNSKSYETKEFENTLYIDESFQCFNVSLENDIGKSYKELNVGEDISYIVPEHVSGSTANLYTNPTISYEEFGKRTFDNIRNLLLHNSDIAYEMLSDKEKYDDLSKFEDFINQNRSIIFLMSFGNYETDFIDDIFTITVYDSNSEFAIKIYYKTFSTFEYEIIEI